MAGRKSGPGSAERAPKVRVRTARRRKPSSTRWLERQLNDPYVAAARREGWRSRAAFKLIELDDKYRFLAPDQRVVDLGAAPGGWSQVAAERVAATGAAAPATVVAVDVQEIEPMAGVETLLGDVRDPVLGPRLLALLGGPADVVLSDMAPPASGHRQTDHLRIVDLVEAAAELAFEVLAAEGCFVAKVWQGGMESGLLAELKRRFRQVRHVKPKASRAESAEIYLLARGYRRPEAP